MFDNTIGVFLKIKEDTQRISSLSDFILQIVFIAMYAYMVAVNTQDLMYLVIYCVLLTVAVSFFTFTAITLRNKDKHFKRVIKKHVRLGVKYTKFAVRVLTLGISVYEIMTTDVTDLTIVVTAAVAICFGVQLLIETSRILVERYINLLQTSVQMDVEEFKNSTVGKTIDDVIAFKASPKAFIAAAVDKPLGNLAEKILAKSNPNYVADGAQEENSPEFSRKQQRRRELISAYAAARKKAVEESKAAKQQEKKLNGDTSFKKELDEIKEHLGIIAHGVLAKVPQRNHHKKDNTIELPPAEEPIQLTGTAPTTVEDAILPIDGEDNSQQ